MSEDEKDGAAAEEGSGDVNEGGSGAEGRDPSEAEQEAERTGRQPDDPVDPEA